MEKVRNYFSYQFKNFSKKSPKKNRHLRRAFALRKILLLKNKLKDILGINSRLVYKRGKLYSVSLNFKHNLNILMAE